MCTHSFDASRWSISHRSSSVACLENIAASYKVSRSVWRMTGRRRVIQYSMANFFVPWDAYGSLRRDPFIASSVSFVSSGGFMDSRGNITLLGGSPSQSQISHSQIITSLVYSYFLAKLHDNHKRY